MSTRQRKRKDEDDALFHGEGRHRAKLARVWDADFCMKPRTACSVRGECKGGESVREPRSALPRALE